MRIVLLLATTSLLAACGGGGGVGSAPPPIVGGPTGPNATEHSFANPTEFRTYVGIGGNQTYEYSTDTRLLFDQQAETFAGNNTTVRDSTIEISYDPADAIYTLRVNDEETAADAHQVRFQDPASRTDFDGLIEPQWGTPELSNNNYQYLQAGDGDPRSPYRRSGEGFVSAGDNDNPPTGETGSAYQANSLFVIEPGSETQYVTLAGFARNALTFGSFTIDGDIDPETGEETIYDQTRWELQRGAFAFGEVSARSAVPKTGSGSYSGSMLATMVFNPTIDGQDPSGLENLPSYFQWIEGTANLALDFTAGSFDIDLDGTVLKPQFDYYERDFSYETVIKEGATFTAEGRGDINLVNFGGFKGFFDTASILNTNGRRYDINIAGSTVDGAFYGPQGQEVGGGFRVVGGNPDERIDIMGAFIGKR